MNNDFASNTFTWVLENHSTSNHHTQHQQQQQPTAITKQKEESFGLSDADLFQFLLGEEAQQAVMSDTKVYSNDCHMEEDSSNSENEAHSPTAEDYKSTQTKSVRHQQQQPIVTSSTSRLDFRPINDYVPESQLKAMTSKERRQLRNKISARNFRNRRKEYIGTLEDELNQQKAENSQLKLEIKWIKAKMEKLQKENDKLRVDLVLGGIVLPSPPPLPQQQFHHQQTSPYLLDSSSIINSTLNLTYSNTSSSSDESNLSSPPNLFSDFPDNWDFALPLAQAQQSGTDTYLSHATVPNWNINQVLSKETSLVPSSTSNNIFQQYPLLAPALMSIVLAHTMTMSTAEILATAKLSSLPPPQNIVSYNDKEPLAGSTIMTNKEAQAVWSILEPLTLMKNRNAAAAASAATIKSATEEETKAGTFTQEQLDQDTTITKKTGCCIRDVYYKAVLPICPINWIQQTLYRYLCEYAADRCIANASQQQPRGKFVLCRQFEKAKKYINVYQ